MNIFSVVLGTTHVCGCSHTHIHTHTHKHTCWCGEGKCSNAEQACCAYVVGMLLQAFTPLAQFLLEHAQLTGHLCPHKDAAHLFLTAKADCLLKATDRATTDSRTSMAKSRSWMFSLIK